LSDAEIEEKYAALAEGVLSSKAQQKLKDAIWNLEKLGSVSTLMALMKADVRGKKVARGPKSSRKKTAAGKSKTRGRRLAGDLLVELEKYGKV
jgi:hypothetical protein